LGVAKLLLLGVLKSLVLSFLGGTFLLGGCEARSFGIALLLFLLLKPPLVDLALLLFLLFDTLRSGLTITLLLLLDLL
jgi:hypothetical protein